MGTKQNNTFLQIHAKYRSSVKKNLAYFLNALKVIGFFTTLSLNTSNLHAQNEQESFEKKFDRAEKIFSSVYLDGKEEEENHSKGGYSIALPLFLDLYKQDPTNTNLAFKLGVCYQSSNLSSINKLSRSRC